MGKRRTMIFALLLLFCCIWSAQAADTLPPSSGTETDLCHLTVYAYRLEGSQEVPLPGVCVALYPPDCAAPIRRTTNNAGLAVFPPLPTGTYTLEETSAPAHYRPLSAPLEVRLSANGPHLREHLSAPAIGILHRRIPWVRGLLLLLLCSLLPALLRLAVLYRKQWAAFWKNFLRLVHLSQSFSCLRRIIMLR